MVHELKTWPEYFKEVKSGNKTFELRKNDRNFKVGDTLVLKEWRNGEYTGDELAVGVTYILPAFFGVSSTIAVMAIKCL